MPCSRAGNLKGGRRRSGQQERQQKPPHPPLTAANRANLGLAGRLKLNQGLHLHAPWQVVLKLFIQNNQQLSTP
jgi:hypothetical protein